MGIYIKRMALVITVIFFYIQVGYGCVCVVPNDEEKDAIREELSIFEETMWKLVDTGTSATKKFWLEQEIDRIGGVDKEDEEGRTLLMMVSEIGDQESVVLLLNRGAFIDKTKSNGGTALMTACTHGHSDVVKTLLMAGADMYQEDYCGNTPLTMAAYNNRLEIVKMLMAHDFYDGSLAEGVVRCELAVPSKIPFLREEMQHILEDMKKVKEHCWLKWLTSSCMLKNVGLVKDVEDIICSYVGEYMDGVFIHELLAIKKDLVSKDDVIFKGNGDRREEQGTFEVVCASEKKRSSRRRYNAFALAVGVGEACCVLS